MYLNEFGQIAVSVCRFIFVFRFANVEPNVNRLFKRCILMNNEYIHNDRNVWRKLIHCKHRACCCHTMCHVLCAMCSCLRICAYVFDWKAQHHHKLYLYESHLLTDTYKYSHFRSYIFSFNHLTKCSIIGR